MGPVNKGLQLGGSAQSFSVAAVWRDVVITLYRIRTVLRTQRSWDIVRGTMESIAAQKMPCVTPRECMSTADPLRNECGMQ